MEVDPRSLKLNDREIYAIMGIGNNEPDAEIKSMTESVKERLLSIARPKFCYTIVDNVDFKYGKIIDVALSQGERYAIFVATVGQEVDDQLRIYRETDIVNAFIADSIASEMAEATARKAIEAIETTLGEGEKISNSYSPGYCGWLLKEQQKLFAYFDVKPCDVELTDSCLMLPIKSVSAVLALGRDVEKAPYGCAICTKTDCYKKRRK